MERKSGILMPVFSLPGKYGIGDFGESAYKFVDFLKKAGQKVWQILPLVQTGFGNSPYSSVCGNSFSPYFIAPDILIKDGLITETEAEFSLSSGDSVDYGFLDSVKFPLLSKAFSRFDKSDKEFLRFKKQGKYNGYALFMAIKNAYGQKPFYKWEKGFREKDEAVLLEFKKSYENEIDFWLFLQFQAEKQWKNLKKYANANGVSILGDLPLYVAQDSVDVWENPEFFDLDENFRPVSVAGVPPDYFSADGQLWGNPVYDYAALEKDGFKWWGKRLSDALDVFDYVRIDHFRGLDRFYKIKYGETTAKNGEWVDVPSEKLFSALHDKIDARKIVAEDLGIIDDGVKKLLKYTGYPGMAVLEFAFNGESDNPYLPENISENCVCYTGTHDNDTLAGFIKNADNWDKNNLQTGVKHSVKACGLSIPTETDEQLAEAIIILGLNSAANTFIIPYQDVLLCGSDRRINRPGVVSDKNWAVKFNEGDFSDEIAQKLKSLCVRYKRYE